MSRRAQAVLGVAAAAAAFAYFLAGRGFPWPLALLVATAIGAFVYTACGTALVLRRDLGDRGPAIRRVDEDVADDADADGAEERDVAPRRGLLGRPVAGPRRPVLGQPVPGAAPREERRAGDEDEVDGAAPDEAREQ